MVRLTCTTMPDESRSIAPSLMASKVVCHWRVESKAASSALRAAQKRANGGNQFQGLGDVRQVAVGTAIQSVHFVFDVHKRA